MSVDIDRCVVPASVGLPAEFSVSHWDRFPGSDTSRAVYAIQCRRRRNAPTVVACMCSIIVFQFFLNSRELGQSRIVYIGLRSQMEPGSSSLAFSLIPFIL
jgi:hypothetical protein